MGFGHKSAAKAIAAALKKDGVKVTIANPTERSETPDILKDIWGMYDQTAKREGLYEFIYKLSDTELASMATDSAVGAMMRNAVYRTVEEAKPDAIVSVHEDFLAPLKSLYELAGFTMPIVTVITDLTTIHRRWFNAVSDITIVPTDKGYRLALTHGLKSAKVRKIGIPVHPDLVQETRTAQEIRAELAWEVDKTTLLVVGSKRVGNLVENLRGINHSNLDVQLVLVAGGDDELYREFQSTTWHVSTHIYNFTEQIPSFMHAADIVISKAGGLIVAETLACGKPMLITDVIEGQETGNLEYVLENGAGMRAFHPLDVLETLYHWLMNDNELLRLRAANARQLGRPRAAFEIADVVQELLSL
jgi:UDP-N-acetylglucosamine:LPS N-acetylglucosamine transferase